MISSFNTILRMLGEIIPALLGDESSSFIIYRLRFESISTINLELKPIEISDPL